METTLIMYSNKKTQAYKHDVIEQFYIESDGLKEF